jgi:hypothetical protein
MGRLSARDVTCHPELVEGPPPSMMMVAVPRQARDDRAGTQVDERGIHP